MLILEILLLLYFAFVSLYSFVLAVAAIFFRMPGSLPKAAYGRIAVLVPAYKEDAVIVHTARTALLQNYPKDKFQVVVIADSLKEGTIALLEALPIKLVKASFEKSTKVNSLKLAFDSLDGIYDYALILDADNVMQPDVLMRLNNMMASGCAAVQAERTSKNSTTSLSVLDGFSERINNFIYRQGHVSIGLCCSLIGSGMIFQYDVVRGIIEKLNSVGGFDRELELALIRQKVMVHYGKGIYVFDEKVETAEVFEKQRTRWLSSQFIYLKKYFAEGVSAFFRGDWRMFNSAILKNIQLPRVINLGLLGIAVPLSFIVADHLRFGPWPYVIFLAMNFAAIAFAIPLKYYNKQMLSALWSLPGVFVRMFKLLFKLRGANKSFIHTPHRVTDANVNNEKS